MKKKKMLTEIKLRLSESELIILDELVKQIEKMTKIRTTRTAVVKASYEHGHEALSHKIQHKKGES